MEKRLILAFSLSLLVLLSWSALSSKFYPIEKQRVINETPSSLPLAAAPIFPVAVHKEIPPEDLGKFSFPKQEVIFNLPQAAIQEVQFPEYQSDLLFLGNGLGLDDPRLVFKLTQVSPDRISFIHQDAEKIIQKEFLFHNSNYSIELVIKMRNLASTPLQLQFPLILGTLRYSREMGSYQDVTVVTKEGIIHPPARQDKIFNSLKFIGLRNRYFCAILEPGGDNYRGQIQKIDAKTSTVGLLLPEILLAPQQERAEKFSIYLGPQEMSKIKPVQPAWQAVVHYGFFDLISQVILQLLGLAFRLTHNWGWSIVLLSLLIYGVLFPLTWKQLRSMKEMQAIQPYIEELRRQYKDNPQKLNRELIELYRQHKVNPLGGCLPFLVQIPIFIALYQVLMRSVALKGAHFLWIKDLSGPDRFLLPLALPIVGREINLLPILMAITMLIQQKQSLAGMSKESSSQQRTMAIMFPLIFVFAFYKLPSGLVLYWFINSSLMLLNQLRVHKRR